MNLLKYPLIFIVLIYSACSKNSNQNTAFEGINKDSVGFTKIEAIDTITAFRNFLSKYRVLKLPIIIKACNFHASTENLPVVNQELDTLFYKNGSSNYCYGLLDDTLHFYALITMAPADCFGPILTIYSKEGKLISNEALLLGHCGSGCGYSCEEFMKIYSNNLIYASDTIRQYDCDSTSNEIPNSYKEFVVFKEGNIDLKGRISISSEQKIDLISK